MQIKAIRNNIIFKFVDATNTKGEFQKTATQSGIQLLGSFDESAKTPRWVNVVDSGPDCKHVKPGTQALLPALRWTNGTKFNDERIWKTDEKEVVAFRESPTSPVIPADGVVIFTRQALVKKSTSGLFVVGGTDDETPRGTVVSIGAKCEPELAGSTIVFDGSNFFDDFVVGGVTYSFIKEDEIAAYEPKPL